MKTLLLNSDDIQNFGKLIYDPKVTQFGGTAIIPANVTTKDDANLVALQYYLKHPGNYMNNNTIINNISIQTSGAAATAPVTATTAASAAAPPPPSSSATTSQSQVYVQSSPYNANHPLHQNNQIHSTSVTTPVNTHNCHNVKNATQQTSLQGSRAITGAAPSDSSAVAATAVANSGTSVSNQQSQQQQQYKQQSNSSGHGHTQLQFHIQLPPQHQHQLQLPLHHPHHHLLNQSQSQLKQLQLKQPTTHHHHQGANYHPYYQTSSSTHAAIPAALTHPTNASQAHLHGHAAHALSIHAHNHPHSNVTATGAHNNTYSHSVPVHALNQNSNFSAASSSTGGGTASSHAPTQQSNTTGSSLSPPGASASTRTKPTSPNVSTTTPSSGLLREKLVNACKKIRIEPTLTDMHRTERLNFANAHFNWTEDHWKRVVFQDERKFNLDGPDGFSCYFHDMRNNERWLSQRPRGNSVFIYLVVTATGPLHLEVSMNKMKVQSCIEIILRERSNIVAKLGGSTDFILQDYNWSIHAPQAVREWLNAEGVKTQKWPYIAHDLNIMEGVWGWLIREVFEGGRKFSRKDDLVFRIRDAWSRLPLELLSNLYSTLPERIMQLSYTNGGLTNC